MIEKILFITLSNIGDAILTLPVLDVLLENFPDSKVTVMSAQRPQELFRNNPAISRVIIFDKHAGLRKNRKLFNELKKEDFDLVVDLRNTLYGALLPAKYKVGAFLKSTKSALHMKDKHLSKIPVPDLRIAHKRRALFISQQDEEHAQRLLHESGIGKDHSLVIIAAGARSHTKQWPKERFSELALRLLDQGNRIALVGDSADMQTGEYIRRSCGAVILNLCAKTNFSQLGAVIKKASLVITNDSAVLHLASYLNVPTAAIFGPTSDVKYGPWSDRSAVIKKEIFCRPCEKAQCRFGTLDCLKMVSVEDVLRQANNLLNSDNQDPRPKKSSEYKRILIVRTDRIGDVLLSTPVASALREAYPQAYIAMMVSPCAKEIVEANPYVDEAIVYDKDVLHKSWGHSVKFSQSLKKKKFDLAIVLHPTNRVHLVTYFAGIKRRVGYDRKMSYLLTDRVRHIKQLGEKHESEYNLDLVRHIGIHPKEKKLFMGVGPETKAWVRELFIREGIKESDKLLAIHPGASCPSKVWPNERFARVADSLIEKAGFKVVIVAGQKDAALAQSVVKNMRYPAVNLAGGTSVAQLAGVFKRCRLLISNDSGPVHVACAVGTPVISVFGRSQAGLSPKRWGPSGARDKILHKDVGCVECLAHDCVKEFACLKAITTEDVLRAVELMQKEGVEL